MNTLCAKGPHALACLPDVIARPTEARGEKRTPSIRDWSIPGFGSNMTICMIVILAMPLG